jgi:hypothetical protein
MYINETTAPISAGPQNRVVFREQVAPNNSFNRGVKQRGFHP